MTRKFIITTAIAAFVGIASAPAFANSVSIQQQGWGNASGGAQAGFNNQIGVFQDGHGNVTAGVQVGNGCDADVQQAGNGNVAAFVQTCP